MKEIVCPECRSTMVHRSRRAGFREEVALRFIFTSPYRCWKCRARFYRVGNERGFNLWIQERGALPSGPSTIPDTQRFDGEDELFEHPLPGPPSFWNEPQGLQGEASREYASTSGAQLEMPLDQGDADISRPVGASIEEGRPHGRRHSSHGKSSSHRYSSQPRRQRQTITVIWLAVVIVLTAALLLYVFSLFSAQAKRQKLVFNESEAISIKSAARRPGVLEFSGIVGYSDSSMRSSWSNDESF
jgi:hypothetical protein